MNYLKILLLPLLLLPLVTPGACVIKNPDNGNPPDDTGITVPPGFSSLIVADNLGQGRHIAVGENGDIYLALRTLKNGKGIVGLRDKNGDYRADSIIYFGSTITTGIEIMNNYLYFSNYSEVYRVPLSPGKLITESNPILIAGGFPAQNPHRDKTFTLDGAGNIYVNVGAPSNACTSPDRTPGTSGLDPCPQLERHAGIWRFSDNKPGQDQVADGHHYASGIRNSIAIAWNKSNNKLYVVQHGRDQLSQLYPNLYTDQESAELPAEEFFLIEDGGFYGWPYCYYDQFKKQKLLAPEYGGNKSAIGRCADAINPIMAFPGHLAPNDLLFYTGTMFPAKYRDGAFIAFHGSWNRAPLAQEGYYVVFVPFKNGLPSGEMEVFADGFAGVDPVSSPGNAKHRPMGLAQGPDGSLYVSDSVEGTIWRISYDGKL